MMRRRRKKRSNNVPSGNNRATPLQAQSLPPQPMSYHDRFVTHNGRRRIGWHDCKALDLVVERLFYEPLIKVGSMFN